jgi:hypothetical protein
MTPVNAASPPSPAARVTSCCVNVPSRIAGTTPAVASSCGGSEEEGAGPLLPPAPDEGAAGLLGAGVRSTASSAESRRAQAGEAAPTNKANDQTSGAQARLDGALQPSIRGLHSRVILVVFVARPVVARGEIRKVFGPEIIHGACALGEADHCVELRGR